MSGWPRIAGFRVVMAWPEDSLFAPEPPPRGRRRIRLAGFTGVSLIVGGALAILVAVLAQQHAPAPAPSAAGKIGPSSAKGPRLHHSPPVSVTIPAIGVQSNLLDLGRNEDGTMQVPDLYTQASEAAWYKYSVTPGQIGTSVIEGHVDSYQGPAVFFRLGALKPGNHIDVTLTDGITAVFRVTGVREYGKTNYPANIIYGSSDYAALRVITCGGAFDPATGHYLNSIVVFASLVSTANG
jgi:Sortase domain